MPQISEETAQTAARLLARFQDDDAIMRGYYAVAKMSRMRVGDRHDHAMAFRRAFLETELKK